MKLPLKLSRSRPRYLLIFASIFLVTLLPAVFYLSRHPSQTQATWFNDSWQYRQKIIVTNNTTVESGVYISFDGTSVLNTSDSTRFQTDCGDIRFTTESGEILSYYIVSGCGTSSTDIDVLLPTFPTGAQNIYFYYGNPQATDSFSASSFTTEATNYTIGSPASEETAPGPVAYWKFDENADDTCSGGSNDVCDSTSYQNDGAFSGSPTWETDTCITDNCLLFDGSDDYITVTDSTSTRLGNTGTVTAWIRPNSLPTGVTWDVILNKGNWGGGRNFYSIYYDGNSDTIRFVIGGPSANNNISISNSKTPPNTWSHVALTWDGSDTYAYINGLQVGTASQTVTPDTSGYDLNIGTAGSSSGYTFNGFIDNVKLYPYARSAAQVKSDYLAGAASQGSSAVLGAQNTSFLNDGLIGYWPMDETSGNASDSSGNGTTLTNNDTTAYSTAKFANGAEPDGTADYFDTADNATLSVTGDLTLAAWIEPDDVSGNQAIIGKFDDSDESYLLTLSEDELRMYIDSSSNYQTTNTTNLSGTTKYHVAGTYNATTQTVHLYVNGQLQASTTTGAIPTSIGDDAGEFSVAAEDTGSTPSNYFDGHIDEARIYNRTLSPAEIAALYHWAPGPVAYWNLDENTGTTLYDRSGSNNSTSLTGSPTWAPGKYGSGLMLDGDDYITVTDSSSVNLSDAGTASLWVKPRSLPTSFGACLLDKRTPDAREIYSICYNSGDSTLLFYLGSDPATATLTIPYSSTPINQWSHITFVWDSSTLSAYLNGIQVDTDTHSALNPDSTGNDLYLGTAQDITTFAFDGLIDDIRLYNYARTGNQIIQDMNAGHPIGGSPIGSMVSHWSFDDAFDDSAQDRINNHDGDLGGSGQTCPNSGDTTCPTYTASGKVGAALDFDTSGTNDDYVDISDSTDFSLDTTQQYSWSFWIYPDDLTNEAWHTIISHDLATNYALNIYAMTTTSNTQWGPITNGITAGIYDNSTGIDTFVHTLDNVINTDTFYHVVVIYDGSQTADERFSFYVNGQDVTDYDDPYSTGTTEYTLNPDSIRIGVNESWPTEYFDGRLDEVKFYHTALTPAQVLIDYNAGKSVNFGIGAQTEASLLSDGAGNSPVAYWPLNENSGTTSVSDHSGNGYDLLMSSFSENAWVSGKYGSALNFNGSSSNLYSSADIDALDISDSEDFTLTGWFKQSTAGNSRDVVISKRHGTAAGNPGYVVYVNDNSNDRFEFEVEDADTDEYMMYTSAAFKDDTWHHFAAVWDDSSESNTTVYIDGAQDEAGTSGTFADIGDLSNTRYIRIGMTNGNENHFLGLIDEVKIFNYALTPAQVAYDFNRGRPVGWWKFDECQGTTAYDSSGHSLTGTITPGAGTNTAAGTCSSGTNTEMWNNGTTGKLNYSLDFDATDDYITIPNSSTIDLNQGLSTGFTISSWIYPNSDGESDVGQIFSKGANTYCRTDSESSSRLDLECRLDLATDATYNLPSIIPISQWSHIALSWTNDSDDEITIWVNGKPYTSSNNYSGDTAAESNAFIIGNNSGQSATFDGLIDDVRVYNYPLSPTQIKQVMQGGTSVRFGPSEGSP